MVEIKSSHLQLCPGKTVVMIEGSNHAPGSVIKEIAKIDSLLTSTPSQIMIARISLIVLRIPNPGSKWVPMKGKGKRRIRN